MSSTPKISWRIPAIDGLRAMACLMVYAFHTWQFSGSPSLPVQAFGRQIDCLGFINAFTAGVDLFMVLSGFCLFWPLCKSHEALARWDWRDYARRRVRRIVPPYYVAILYAILLPVVLVALFRLLKMDANWQPLPSAWQIITHVLFIHTLFPGTWDGITGAFWSLGLEAQFYVVFPFVVFAFRKAKAWVLISMVAISIVYRIIAYHLTVDSGFHERMVASIFFLGRWMQFAAGMAAAWIVATHWRPEGKLRNSWVGAGLFVLALILYILGTVPTAVVAWIPKALPTGDLLLSAAFAVGIVAICATHSPIRRLFSNRVSAGLGYFSYSVFLIHQPTAWYLSEMLRKKLHLDGVLHYAVMMSIGLLLVCGIAYLFFLLFERPFLTVTRRSSKSTDAEALLARGVTQQAAP